MAGIDPSGRLAPWTYAAPLIALAVLGLKYGGVLDLKAAWAVVLAAGILGATVFAAVHHAEVIALKVGEPFGSIVLAAAVTIIEVALIVSLMLSAPDGAPAVARDTVFAAVMIVMNGIVGLCLLVGGMRHKEQDFQLEGTGAGLTVIGTLALLVLILPKFSDGPIANSFSNVLLIFVGIFSIVLYLLFLFVQTVRHRDYFLDVSDPNQPTIRPSAKVTLVSLTLLLVALVGVVLLAKSLSPIAEAAIVSAGLPLAFVGVLIALVVLLPEGIAAVRSAKSNRLQTSLNLSLGSALATIGLTIPVVAILSIVLDTPLILGLGPGNSVILLLTLFVSTLTLATGRTTILQGGVHLVVFAAFLVVAAGA